VKLSPAPSSCSAPGNSSTGPSERDLIRRRRVAGTRELPAASLQQGRIGRRCFWSRLGQLIKTCGCVAGRPGRTRLFHEGRRQTPEPVLDVCEQRRVGYVLRLHGCDERHLLLEKLCDVAVQGSRRVEVFNRDPLVLTETIATVLRLGMIGRHPVEVLEDDMREVAVYIELEKNRWMISWPARRTRRYPIKPKVARIKFFNKYINHADRVVLTDPVVQPIRKQGALAALFALNKTLHQNPRG